MDFPLLFSAITVPNVGAIRRVFELDPALGAHDVIEYAYQRSRALSGEDRLPAHLLRLAAIISLRYTAQGGWQVQHHGAVSEVATLSAFLAEIAAVPVVLCWDADEVRAVLRCRALANALTGGAALFAKSGLGGEPQWVDLAKLYAVDAALPSAQQFARMLDWSAPPPPSAEDLRRAWLSGAHEILATCSANQLRLLGRIACRHLALVGELDAGKAAALDAALLECLP